MRVLITGSWLQHNSVRCDDAMIAAQMVGIEPSHIVTGCWVGADQLGIAYAKKNGIPHSHFDLSKQELPSKIDAVVLLSHKNESGLEWIIDACELLGLASVVW